MQFVLPDLRPASAEIFLLLMSCVLLIVDLFVKEPRRTLTFTLSLLILALTAGLTWMIGGGDVAYTFNRMYVADALGDLLKLVVYGTMILVLIYSRTYVLARPNLARGEFYVLSLFATLGMLVMISANHLLTVYIGIELLSLSLYAMVALNRDSVAATEAAMKYFVLGALASGLLLYGMSMLYGATGTLEITELSIRLSTHQFNPMILIFGLIFLVAGLAFKLGVVPFHMWVPDVYHGAPTAVTLILATAPKLAAFAIVIRLLVEGLIVVSRDWQMMLLVFSVLSIALGNLAAIAQVNLKRMLAYSAISHMGFMLLGLVTGVVGGDPRFAFNAYSSSLFYVLTYVLTSAGTFGTILLLSRAGFEADSLDDLKGLNKRSPWFAAVMMMMMFSMAGIPFFGGFFAKFSVLQAVMVAGYLWLALFAVLFSLIGAFYYLRVVKLMYFDEPNDSARIDAPVVMKGLMSANGLAVALLGIFPQQLMLLCLDSLMRSL
ncbi:MAG: NADH-quinone oxidoreductase subunit NuoN [Pseudomonadota bacterium]